MSIVKYTFFLLRKLCISLLFVCEPDNSIVLLMDAETNSEALVDQHGVNVLYGRAPAREAQ